MKISRREFLTRSAMLAGASSVPLAFSAPASAFSDNGYKALVCIFLRGGNDSANMVIPLEHDLYSAYQQRRQGIAIPRADILFPGVTDGSGSEIGLHPSLPNISNLFNQGSATAVLNVGPLVGPDHTPSALFSHNSQQEAWESRYNTNHQISSPYGWGGLLMEVLSGKTDFPELISLGGNTLLNSSKTSSTRLNPEGSMSSLEFFDDFGIETYESLFEHEASTTIFAQSHHVHRQFLSEHKNHSAVFEATPLDSRISRDTSLGAQLSAVKRAIDASQGQYVGKQLFIVNLGGFDTHKNQLGRHSSLFEEMDTAIYEFYSALAADGLGSSVTTFTQSEFGRTMHNNSNLGTDHGWGGHQLVIGDAVLGGQCAGNYPDFSPESPDDHGNGRLKPSIAHEQMCGTLSSWLGASQAALNHVFPNASQHYDLDLGFMSK